MKSSPAPATMSSREPLFGTCCHVLLMDPFWQPLSCPPCGLLFASAIMSSWLPTLVNNYHVFVLNPSWYLPSCPPGDPLSYSWYPSSCPQGAPLLLQVIMLPPTPPQAPAIISSFASFLTPVSMSFWWRSLCSQYHILWRSTSCPPFSLTLGTSHQALLICIITTQKNSVDKDC